MKIFKKGQTFYIKPDHYTFYLDHHNLKREYATPVLNWRNEPRPIQDYQVEDILDGERVYINKSYYIMEKIINDIKYKNFKPKAIVLETAVFEHDDQAVHIKWVSPHGEYFSYVLLNELIPNVRRNVPEIEE